ncbi:MAG TPA: hypothetical protein DIT97_05840 [Gimesia maris]|uniref:Uncharacterized protein n=1 Tax=Gimesia maris TaxID=122 RepID=A0A3D3R189_9PLAN|nr:hypothetical protein [Gimesia maris]
MREIILGKLLTGIAESAIRKMALQSIAEFPAVRENYSHKFERMVRTFPTTSGTEQDRYAAIF